MENTQNLLCPCCKTKLVYTHSDRYQDMAEHCSQPNAEPSIKAAFQCPNTECVANLFNVSWIEDGDYYTDKIPEYLDRSQIYHALQQTPAEGCAINSWQYHYHIGKEAIKSRKKRIKIGSYLIDIEPKENGYEHPLATQYMPRKFGWNFRILKTTEDGSLTMILPIHQMILFRLRQFNSDYDWVIKNPDKNKSKVKDALENANGTMFGYPDERPFSKIASFIIKTLYWRKVQKLIKINKALNLYVYYGN